MEDEETFEEPIEGIDEVEDKPIPVGMNNEDMVMVCTLVINNIPIMYEWLSKDEADRRVKEIYKSEIKDDWGYLDAIQG